MDLLVVFGSGLRVAVDVSIHLTDAKSAGKKSRVDSEFTLMTCFSIFVSNYTHATMD